MHSHIFATVLHAASLPQFSFGQGPSSGADGWLLLCLAVFLSMAFLFVRHKTKSAHHIRESSLRSLRGDAKNRDQAAADQALLEIFQCGKHERDVELGLGFARIATLLLGLSILIGIAVLIARSLL